MRAPSKHTLVPFAVVSGVVLAATFMYSIRWNPLPREEVVAFMLIEDVTLSPEFRLVSDDGDVGEVFKEFEGPRQTLRASMVRTLPAGFIRDDSREFSRLYAETIASWSGPNPVDAGRCWITLDAG